MLPYNDDVIAYVRRWCDAGGRAVLVSAADQRIVDRVADHLGLFEAAYGSDGQVNLKGARKAAFLAERYPDGFAYIGDKDADYAIWQKAARAITVDVSRSLRSRVDALTVESEHLTTRGSYAGPLARAIRPQQWLKNVLVFLPLLAAHRFDLVTISEAALAFVAYSLVASSVYLLNDLLDLEADRAHPRKRERPFAAGALPLSWGTALAPGLLLAGGLVSVLLGPEFMSVADAARCKRDRNRTFDPGARAGSGRQYSQKSFSQSCCRPVCLERGPALVWMARWQRCINLNRNRLWLGV